MINGFIQSFKDEGDFPFDCGLPSYSFPCFFQLIWLLLSISEKLLPTKLVFLLNYYFLSPFPHMNAHVPFYPSWALPVVTG